MGLSATPSAANEDRPVEKFFKITCVFQLRRIFTPNPANSLAKIPLTLPELDAQIAAFASTANGRIALFTALTKAQISQCKGKLERIAALCIACCHEVAAPG